MIWQLLRGYNTYGGAEVSRRSHSGQLDEVKCGGNLNLDRVGTLARSLSWGFVMRSIRLLSSEEELKNIFKPEVTPGPLKIVSTSPMYLTHLRQLSKWGIVSQTERHQLIFCSTYFAVPKDANLDRAIFNGRRLSNLFMCPPSVGIADISLVNKRLSDLMRGVHESKGESRRVFGFVADFRHFFHQIPLAPSIRRLFGIACGEHFFLWNSLPMGWSWSPLLAQCIGWTLLCGRLENEESLFDEGFTKDLSLPSFIPLASDLGFCALYYDNIIVVGTCPKQIQAIKARLTRNMRMCGRLDPGETIKELKTFGPSTRTFVYLGCEYRLEVQRDRLGHESWVLHWRCVEKNLPVLELWSAQGSARAIARRIGKSLYRWLLEDRPLVGNSRAVEVLELLRRVSTIGPKNWDAPFPCSEEELGLLERCRQELVANPWISRTRSTARVFVVSDASTSKGYGYFIVHTVHGTLTQVASSGWPVGMDQLHIFFLEAYAALRGLQQARILFPEETSFGLITDNTAVAGALKRGYSSTEIVRRWMLDYEYLSYDTEVYTVPSEHNAADPLSRLIPTVIDLPGVLDLIQELQSGRRSMNTPTESPGFTGDLRHPEPLEDIWEELFGEVNEDSTP